MPEEVALANSMNREVLTKDNMEWLQAQPISVNLEADEIKITIFHSNPVTPIEGYIQADEIGTRMNDFYNLTRADLLILGHTHRPYIQSNENFTVINPGSVGLPRDEARTSFMVLEVNKGMFEITHRRLQYDYDLNANAMVKLGIPKKIC